MEFGINKCAMLVMKSGKRHMREGIDQANQEYIRMLGEKENYSYLGILEADTIRQVEMKEKNLNHQWSPETGVQTQVESYQRLKKWYLIPPCLTLSIKFKVEQSREMSCTLPYTTLL